MDLTQTGLEPPMEFAPTFSRSTRSLADLTLDGIQPLHAFAPREPDELARLLAECNRQVASVTPWGGGTLQHLGGIPRGADVIIQTSALDQVLDYSPDDLTISVQAGITLSQVQTLLATRGQFLPVDAPCPERSTIGGILATGVSGPLRLRYGPPRDLALGLKFAVVEGHIVKAGGRVVKNVAGYELTKLLIGSLGTLGIITEATFKVYPRPNGELTMLASLPNSVKACELVLQAWRLSSAPLALELFGPTLAKQILPSASGWLVAARFAGSKAALAHAGELGGQIAWQHDALKLEFLEDGKELWRAISDLPGMQGHLEGGTVLRISAPPKELGRVLDTVSSLAEKQRIRELDLFAHAATAVAYAGVRAEEELTLAFVRQLRAELAGLGAIVVVESAPVEVKRAVDVWGDPGPSLKLMESIKKQFDPNGILNPGRFVGGL